MATVNLIGHVYMTKDYEDQPKYSVLSFKTDNVAAFGVYVGELAIQYEVPADFNPVAAEVKALEAKKAEALDAYNSTVAQINERLSKLLAITHDA